MRPGAGARVGSGASSGGTCGRSISRTSGGSSVPGERRAEDAQPASRSERIAARTLSTSQDLERLVRASEHSLRVAAEPVLDHARVDAPEIKRGLEVPVGIQVAEVRLSSVEPGPNASAEQQYEAGRAVVGTRVGADPALGCAPAELADHEYQHLLEPLEQAQFGEEGSQRKVELRELALLSRALARVRVEAVVAHVEAARGELGCDDVRHALQRARQRSGRVFDSRPAIQGPREKRAGLLRVSQAGTHLGP